MESPGYKVGFDLPHIGIELDTASKVFHGFQPAWKGQGVELKVAVGAPVEAAFDGGEEVSVGEDHNPMEAGQLKDHIPTQDQLAATEGGRTTTGTAGESGNENAKGRDFILHVI